MNTIGKKEVLMALTAFGLAVLVNVMSGCATDASGTGDEEPDSFGDMRPVDELAPEEPDTPDDDADNPVDDDTDDDTSDEDDSDDTDDDTSDEDDSDDTDEDTDGHSGGNHCGNGHTQSHGKGHGQGHGRGHDCDDEDEGEEPICELPSEEETLGHRPFVSYASLPSSVLVAGVVTHGRIVVTADAGQDIVLRQLTFNVRHSGVLITLDSEVREVGTGTYLDATTATHCYGGVDICSEYDVTIAFREDVWVAAGTSKAFDIDTTVSGISSEDWIQTSFMSDGTLVSACELEDDGFSYGIAGTTPNFIWTDEAGVHHSGAGVTPFGPMTLVAP